MLTLLTKHMMLAELYIVSLEVGVAKYVRVTGHVRELV